MAKFLNVGCLILLLLVVALKSEWHILT